MNDFDIFLEKNLKVGKYQIILLIVACLLQFVTALIESIVQLMNKKTIGEYFLTDNQAARLMQADKLGSLFGGLLIGTLSDIFGRHNVLLVDCFFGVLIAFIPFLFEGYWAIEIFDITLGLFVSGLFVVLPGYLFEVLPKDFRGRITVVFKSFTTVGRTLGNFIVGYLIFPYQIGYWKRTIILNSFFTMICLIFFIFLLQESVRYLYTKNKFDELICTINKIFVINNAAPFKLKEPCLMITNSDLSLIKANKLIRPSSIKKENIAKLYFTRENMYNNIVINVSRMMIQILYSGFKSMWSEIFGATEEITKKITYVSAGEFLGIFICTFIIDHPYFGRRKTAYIFCFIAAVVFFFLSLNTDKDDLNITSTTNLFFLFLTRAIIKCGVVGIEVYSFEAYPMKIRGFHASINSFLVGLTLYMAVPIINFFRDKGQMKLTYGIFGVFMACVTVGLFFLKPDCKR
jgi:putative MFS transporter